MPNALSAYSPPFEKNWKRGAECPGQRAEQRTGLVDSPSPESDAGRQCQCILITHTHTHQPFLFPNHLQVGGRKRNSTVVTIFKAQVSDSRGESEADPFLPKEERVALTGFTTFYSLLLLYIITCARMLTYACGQRKRTDRRVRAQAASVQ